MLWFSPIDGVRERGGVSSGEAVADTAHGLSSCRDQAFEHRELLDGQVQHPACPVGGATAGVEVDVAVAQRLGQGGSRSSARRESSRSTSARVRRGSRVGNTLIATASPVPATMPAYTVATGPVPRGTRSLKP